MKLRPYRYGEDYPLMEAWITDERAHALWCARRFPWPLTQESFEGKLRALEEKGDRPFIAETEEGEHVGFVCWSPGPAVGEGRLKFVVVDPKRRGRGVGRELVSLAAAWGKAQGAETARLSVFTVNLAARRCYERAGFTPERLEEGVFPFYEENWGRCDMSLRL